MIRWFLLSAYVWLAPTPAGAQTSAPPPAQEADRLDGGLLDPAWFGPGPTWSRSWRADFFWVRPGHRWDRAVLHLRPWEEPRLPAGRGPLDYASGWEAAEHLQSLLRTRLGAVAGIRLAASPEDTPYHAQGRLVEATHIRQGAMATLGPLAGLPTYTWDFKVVDTRTGETLLASHHRSISAPASTWVTALEAPLREMAGLPPLPPWEAPPGHRTLADGSWTWALPEWRLPAGSVAAGAWTADTDTGGWWKGWTHGQGASLAGGARRAVQVRLARSSLAPPAGTEPAYLLTGQVFSSAKYLKVRYRAQLTELATGRIVARAEIRSPFRLPQGILEEVSDQVVGHLEALTGEAPTTGPAPEIPLRLPEPGPPGLVGLRPMGPALGPGSGTPSGAWEGLERLRPAPGAVDRAWVSPAFRLAGCTLQVASWPATRLPSGASAHDQRLAEWISGRAPAWLFGALATHGHRGFRIDRQSGDLRLEGRVVHLDQPDRGNFLTDLGGALSFGLSLQSEGTLQLRVVEVRSGETLALAERKLHSFQVASDGIPYQAFKWLAQELVPWLLEAARSPEAERPPVGGLSASDRKELSPSLPRP